MAGTTTPPATTSVTDRKTEESASPLRKSDRRSSELYGMNEYLMIAHEMEKARLLARETRKRRSSPIGSPPEDHKGTSGEDDGGRVRDDPCFHLSKTARSSPKPPTTR